MRKKKLIAQNLSMFEQLEALRAQIAAKDKKIAELEKRISESGEREEKKETQITPPLKKLEEKVISNSHLSPEVEYASEAIGKLVLESAAKCGELTADSGTENRELVNLLLGKTEVAKAEILSIVSDEGNPENKKERIDAVADEALDYFGSILAQLE